MSVMTCESPETLHRIFTPAVQATRALALRCREKDGCLLPAWPNGTILRDLFAPNDTARYPRHPVRGFLSSVPEGGGTVRIKEHDTLALRNVLSLHITGGLRDGRAHPALIGALDGFGVRLKGKT